MEVQWPQVLKKIQYVNLEGEMLDFAEPEKRELMRLAGEMRRARRYESFVGDHVLQMEMTRRGAVWIHTRNQEWYAEGALLIYGMVTSLLEEEEDERAADVMKVAGKYIFRRHFKLESRWGNREGEVRAMSEEGRRAHRHVVTAAMTKAGVPEARLAGVMRNFGIVDPRVQEQDPEEVRAFEADEAVQNGAEPGDNGEGGENHDHGLQPEDTDVEDAEIRIPAAPPGDILFDEDVEEETLGMLAVPTNYGRLASTEEEQFPLGQMGSTTGWVLRPMPYEVWVEVKWVRSCNYLLILDIGEFGEPLVWGRLNGDGPMQVYTSMSGIWESVPSSYRHPLSEGLHLEEAALKKVEENTMMLSPLRVYNDGFRRYMQVGAIWWRDIAEEGVRIEDCSRESDEMAWHPLEQWCASTYRTHLHEMASFAWHELSTIRAEERNRLAGELTRTGKVSHGEREFRLKYIVGMVAAAMISINIGVWWWIIKTI